MYEIDDYAPPANPTPKHGGKRGSKYPFDKLEVGKSFHVPPTKAMPDPATSLASLLTVARRRHSVPELNNGIPVLQSARVKTFKKGLDGKRLKVDGKFVVETQTIVQRPKMVLTRDFYIVPAAATDPRGPGARIVRSK